MRVVLDLEARVYQLAEVGPPPCVMPQIGRATFGGNRRRVEAFEQPAPPDRPRVSPRTGPLTIVEDSEFRLSPYPAWHHPGGDHRGHVDFGGRLDPDVDARLRQVQRAVMIAPPQRRPVDRIDPAWLQSPLEFCSDDPSTPYLEIDSPVVSGDVAFIGVAFQCVLCGRGMLLALRRTHGTWEIFAVAQTWVS